MQPLRKVGFTSEKGEVHMRHTIAKGVWGACLPGKKIIFGKNIVHFL